MRGLVVENKGFQFDEVDVNDEDEEAVHRIRGYKLAKTEWSSAQFSDEGEHLLEETGPVHRASSL